MSKLFHQQFKSTEGVIIVGGGEVALFNHPLSDPCILLRVYLLCERNREIIILKNEYSLKGKRDSSPRMSPKINNFCYHVVLKIKQINFSTF